MNFIKKKLLAVFAVLVFALAPLAIAGCGEEGTMSVNEYQDFQIAAAQSFKEGHTDFETFRDITYHWTESVTEKEKVQVSYNQIAEGEDYTTGTFENKTVTNVETWLAVKKTNDSLVAKLTVNTTVVQTTHAQNAINNNQLGVFTDTTVTQEVYYVTPATLGTETLNVVAYYKSQIVNDEDAVITKKYEQVATADILTEKIQGYALQCANTTIVKNFFSYAEILMYPGYNGKLVKEGNRVTLSGSYVFSEVNTNLDWGKSEMSVKIVYENGKVLKSQIINKSTTEDASEDISYAFDYVNSASIEALDLDGYTSASGIINNYQNYCQSHIHA